MATQYNKPKIIMAMDEDQKKCGGISAIGIAAILMSLACFVIGAINIDFSASQDFASTCKAEPKIPFYLLVAGVLNIIIIVLRLIFQRCCRKCGEPGEDNKVCNSLNFLCRFSCITIYDLLALAIVVIWLVIGSAMALVFGLLAKFCSCFWNIICCKPCKEAEANQV